MRFRLIAIAVCGLAFGGQADAQTPSDIERVWAQARAVSSAPVNLDREHAAWLAERASDHEADVRWEGVWRRSAARDAAARRMTVSSDALAQSCVDLGLDGCTTPSGGYLKAGEARLHWQIQDGSTDEDGVTAGFVLLEETPRGLTPVAWGFEGIFYGPPVFLREGEAMYVAVPGTAAGTGHFNVDRLYRWTPGEALVLTQIDNEAWKDDLAERLPAGLGVWQGVDFQYEGLNAHTSLWQDDDGNCCATGGDAWLNFAIEGDALVLKDISVNDALFTLAGTVPSDVYDYVGRWVGCSHWGGEEAYDDDRREEIKKAVVELRCETLIPDGGALRAKYIDRAPLTAVIDRALAQGD